MKIIPALKKHGSNITILVLVMTTLILSFSIYNSSQIKRLSGNSFGQLGQTEREMEKAYRKDLRDFLCQAGFSDSGINMTKTVNLGERPDETAALSYTVAIYHRKISELSADELSSLLTDIVEIDLPIAGSIVSYKFM